MEEINEVEEVSVDYISPYTNMVKFLKVLSQDLRVLHHCVTGPAFFDVHKQLGEMYEDVDDIVDGLIEQGMTIGILEPSIEDSLILKPSVDIKLRNVKDTLTLVVEWVQTSIEYMEQAKQLVPSDIKNKIEEYEHTLRIWGLYKSNMAIVE